jgi:signal transduction histidine kinase
MAENPTLSNRDFAEAFVANERQERLRTGKVASVLVVVLMPLGSVMDWLVYHPQRWYFLELRILCSVLAAGLWYLHTTELGQKHYRWLGIPIALLPAFFMCWIIAAAQGPLTGATSNYYAALNLILLAVSVVVRWDAWESMFCVAAIILMYLAACGFHWLKPTPGEFFNNLANNLYFMALTGIIVIVGNHFFYRLRFSEFALRYELDKNRAALEESNRKLLELDQIKSRFFANISHELRTPLTLLLAPLETLLHRFNRAFDEDTRNLLVTMHANGMRLLKLINDLLALVRLESGRMAVKREPLAVVEFVKGLASAARQVADDKHIRLETYVDPALGTVRADRDKLEKIVLNLMFNALKFTPAGGRVTLGAEKQGEEFVLIVNDTGMGIAEKNLPFIFDRFWQADVSSKRKYQGVGIGLALVKELVEIQNGKVTVESQEGQGTTFTVRLPYKKAEAMEKEPPAETGEKVPSAAATGGTVTSEEWLANLYRRAELFPALTPLHEAIKPVELAGGGKRATVLVADDEPDMLQFLKSQLAARYEVIEAVDGQQAVEKAGQFLPDIILLDMMMPEKDGLQACREIHAHTPTQNIPVILLTARADEETKFAALEAGASDFLAKPFSTTELHVRIRNLVESHDYQRRLSKQNQALESTIEQLKETESQLVQTEKLASLGRMSAGIIHEINNPLNFATTGLFALRHKSKFLAPEQRGEYEAILKDVEEGIKRVQNIVSDLRTFTHPDAEQRDEVEVADVVGAALRFLSGEWRDKVRIEQRLAEHQTVWANRNKLVHVMVNLLQNSLDALRRKKFDGEQPTIWLEGRVENNLSVVVVRDNGPGIDEEHLNKIFDPFFTTKDVGEGMGLGLSICYRIVRQYDGRISVKTVRGQFCEFTLEFPVRSQSAKPLERHHGEFVQL